MTLVQIPNLVLFSQLNRNRTVYNKVTSEYHRRKGDHYAQVPLYIT